MYPSRCTACHSRRFESIIMGTTFSRSTDRRFRITPSSSLYRKSYYKCSLCVQSIVVLAVFLAVMVPGSDSCFPGGRLIRRLPKSEPPLIYKQHVPNVPENSLAASGPREGRIRKFNKRFQELVISYNPDIIFKDEEGTGEDRIMSVRCKEKLDALAMLVMNFWPGVKLRVTEAWDQDGFHAPDSLHYEGRAVDITTSDRDRNKYGLLARLAAQAGFDWVYYENRMHVHASVKSDSVTRHKRALKCFPGRSTVLTENGDRKSIRDLVVGDRVAVLSRNGYGPAFEPVIAFLHRDSLTTAEFVEARTNRMVFAATSEHLIYVLDSNGWSHQPYGWPLLAKSMHQLIEGDTVMVSNTTAGDVHMEKVVSIRSTIEKGFYAPLTPSGTILVDGVLASCYAAVHSEPLAHWSLSPLRLWYQIIDSTWSQGNTKSHQSDGIHWYAEMLLHLAKLLEWFNIGGIIDYV